MRYFVRHTTCALIGALATMSAAAQSTDKGASTAGGLEEIVVTATRRAERLQDVAISVTAFSQEKLDAQGLRNIDDLSRLSPGVTFSRNGMGSSANYNDEGSDINIRGVDSTAGASTTGIYIDDTPIQTRHIGFGSVNAFPVLFDLDHVEVLRGPQGTLFGAGAEGGVVRFISPEPSLKDRSGYDRAELGTTKGGALSYEVGAAFGGPIIDDVLGFRVSASFRRDGGWVDRVGYTLNPTANPNTPIPVYNGTNSQSNANWQQTTTLRGALTLKVSDSVQITPSIYYQRLHINDTAAYWVALSNPSSGIFRNGNALPNGSTDPFYLGSLKVKWDLGSALLTSNTSYLSRDQSSVSDYTQYLRATWASIAYVSPTPVPPTNAPLYQLPNSFPVEGDKGYAPFADSQRNFYEEIRLASMDPNARFIWNGGLFFSHSNENVSEDIIDPTLDAEVTAYTGGADSVCFPPSQPCPNGMIFHGPTNRVVDKQIAAFGEVAFKLTDTFKATLGLRVSKIDFTGSVNATGPFLGTTIISQLSASEKPVTPKLALAWQPDHDELLYFSVAKGFRPGGVNVGVGTICGPNLITLGLPQVGGQRQVPGQFTSDSLWSYELGAKGTFFDHTLQINASIFNIDWSNIQQNVYLPACGEQFTANLGKVKSVGGDIEVIFKPIERLTFDVTAAYVDAKFVKSSCAGVLTFDGVACSGTDPVTGTAISVPPIVSKGDRLIGAPWSFTAAAEYHFIEWSGRMPYARLDFQYGTAQRAHLNTQNSQDALNDVTIPGLPITRNLSLRAGLRFNGFDLSLYAQNLTNSQPLLFKSRDIAFDGTDTLYFGRGVRPLNVGLTATYRY